MRKDPVLWYASSRHEPTSYPRFDRRIVTLILSTSHRDMGTSLAPREIHARCMSRIANASMLGALNLLPSRICRNDVMAFSGAEGQRSMRSVRCAYVEPARNPFGIFKLEYGHTVEAYTVIYK